jgi:hypothetical protein
MPYTTPDACPLSSSYTYNAVLDRCIKAHTNTKPFIKAREVCEKENAALVKIDSYEMWIFVTTVVCMYRLTAWARWAAARVTNSIRGHAYLVFCRYYLSFFFWALCCLSFFDLRILITSL